MSDHSTISEAAERLRQATEQGAPCAPVRDLLGASDIAAAYAVQDLNTRMAEAAGRVVTGWKIGLTSKAVQRQLGVDQPDFGVLFSDREIADHGTPVPMTLLQPRIEAEIAFVLGDDLDDRPLGVADILRATEFVVPALEVVDSRVAGWDISIVDTIADNASSGQFVLGPVATLLRSLDLGPVTMSMTEDGAEVSSGRGRDCLGHPVNAVVWLANTARHAGRPLRAGDVVLSGALGPMIAVKPGSSYEATIGELGPVRIEFAATAWSDRS